MPEAPLTDYMRTRLRMTVADTDYYARRNREERARGKARGPYLEGRQAKPDRTYYALEKRGLVDKSASAPGLKAGQLLWTPTEAGRKEAARDRP